MREMIEDKVKNVLASCGIILLEYENISISMDSLQWVSFIVELEETFDITLDDEIMLMNDDMTFEKICEIIGEYIE